jgi:hypothetical protein
MLRILGRRDSHSREALLLRRAERAAVEPSPYLGVYVGTDPDLTAIQSTVLRLL